MYATRLEERTGPSSAEKIRLFEALILPHEASLYGPAFALTHSVSDAEDLVQDTMLRAFARFDSFRADGSPRAWLHTIMRNLYFNAHRKRNREPKQVSFSQLEEAGQYDAAEQEAATLRPATASPERQVLSQMEGDALRQAVDALPPEYREVVALADMDGLAYQEIALRLHIPIGTVRSRLSRGRERVRQALRPWRGEGSRRQVAGTVSARRAVVRMNPGDVLTV